MTVRLILFQTRSVVNEKYRIQNEITSSSGIEKEVFVKRESNYEYDRVASLQDMLDLPTIPDPTLGYYRDHVFYQEFSDVSEADLFSSGIKSKLSTLTNLYDRAIFHYLGSETTTIKST